MPAQQATKLRKQLATTGPLLSIAGVARTLGVSRQSVHKRAERGTLPEPIGHDDEGRAYWVAAQFVPGAKREGLMP